MLMTALIIELALLPVLLIGDIPGLEILRPAAFVIFCGMITCTLVNFFALPSLYLRFGEIRSG
jgi:Cu/Ag efflux pump CusA